MVTASIIWILSIVLVLALDEVAFRIHLRLEVLKAEKDPNSLSNAARRLREAYITQSDSLNSCVRELLSHYEQDENGLYLVKDEEGNQLREYESSITYPVYSGYDLKYFPVH